MQTRHSTGAVRERRVWDFSRKRLKSEKSDTTPRLLVEQFEQDEMEKKHLKLVIPYGQEEKLSGNLKENIVGQVELSSLVSLHANNVKLFQGECVCLDDGSRAVKVPKVEQENEIILIAVSNTTKTFNTEQRDCKGEAQETETLETPTVSDGNDNSTELDDKCKTDLDCGVKYPYICGYCGKSFSNAIFWVNHVRCHTGERPYLCRDCNKSFSQKSCFESHMMQHTGERPFKCQFCEKAFRRSSLLKVHTRHHTGEKPFVCDHCGNAFRDPGTLKVHVRFHTGERPYKCQYCDRAFVSSTARKRHMTKHTSEKKYMCTVCYKAFSQKRILKGHMRTHTGEKPFVCDHCGKAFRDATTLKVHVRFHTGERPYKCQYCDRVFVSSSARKSHMKIHTVGKGYRESFLHENCDKNKKYMMCRFCGKGFESLMDVKSHLTVHTEEQVYACKECGKIFGSDRRRNAHMATHTKIRVYLPCEICGKNLASLNRRRHSDQTYDCKICDQKFKDGICFKNHVKAHAETQPFVCSKCGMQMQFVLMSHLKGHSVTHSKSTVQQIIAASNSSVKVHVERLHSDPFLCSICGYFFMSLSDLEKHSLTHIPKENTILLDITQPLMYACTYCDTQYENQYHFKIQHSPHLEAKDITFKCATCKQTFEKLSLLEEHVKLHKHLRFKYKEPEKVTEKVDVVTEKATELTDKPSPEIPYVGGISNGTLIKFPILKDRLHINGLVLSVHQNIHKKSGTVTSQHPVMMDMLTGNQKVLEHVPDSGNVDSHVEQLEQVESADMSVELENSGQIEKEENSLEHGD